MTNLAALQIAALWPALLASFCAVLLPLVAGLPPIIAIMESVYVMTGREMWKQAARFWSTLFRAGLMTGAFGALALLILCAVDAVWSGHGPGWLPGVAIAAFIVVAFGGEIWLFKLFSRDWWGFSRPRHFFFPWALMVPPSLVLFAVAVTYGWLDNPAGTAIDPAVLRIRVVDVPAMLLNPAAQVKFVHLAGASYLAGAACVLAGSAWYLLRKRNVRIARASMTVAAGFGLASALSLAVLGDHGGYAASPTQKMKIAAIAAEWHTQDPPAAFTLFGVPDPRAQTTRAALRVPWLLGLGATHSWRKSVAGMDELVAANAVRIRDGADALRVRDFAPHDPLAHGNGQAMLAQRQDPGYGLLLLNHGEALSPASADRIMAAAHSTVPNVPVSFWAFRGMAVLGVLCLVLFGWAFYLASRRQLQRPGFSRLALWSLPLPWLAGGLGWVVDEVGRGPWLVGGMLPFVGARMYASATVVAAIAVLVLVILVIFGVVWIARVVRVGPDGMNLWPADSGQAKGY